MIGRAVRRVGCVVVGACAVVGALVVAPAGAVTVLTIAPQGAYATFPSPCYGWCAVSGTTAQNNAMGGCNVKVVDNRDLSGAPGVGTWGDDFWYYSCNIMSGPTTDTTGVQKFVAVPTVPTQEANAWNAWTFPTAYTGPVLGSSMCAINGVGATGVLSWYQDTSNVLHYDCTAVFGGYGASIFTVANTSAARYFGQIWSITVGAPALASDGHDYRSLEYQGYVAGNATHIVMGPTTVGIVTWKNAGTSGFIPTGAGTGTNSVSAARVCWADDATCSATVLSTNIQLSAIFYSDANALSYQAPSVPYWFSGGVAGAGQDCAFQALSGPDSNTSFIGGVAYSWTVTWSGAAQEILVDPMDGTGGTSLPTVQTIGVFTGLGSDTKVNVVNAVPIGGGNYTANVTVTPTNSGQWDPMFYCIGSTGSYSWFDLQRIDGTSGAGSGSSTCSSGQTATPVGCGQALGQCLSNAGAGLSYTNPATWVGALLDGVSCIFSWAFVPASFDTSNMLSPITGHAPYTYVADGISAANTMLGGVNTSLGGAVCNAPVITAPIHALAHVGSVSDFTWTLPQPASLGCSDVTTSVAGVTSGHGVGDLYGYRGLIRDVLTLGVWVAALIGAWEMLPFARSGDGVRVVARGAGLNLDGEYVDTAWTNEGSGGGWDD